MIAIESKECINFTYMYIHLCKYILLVGFSNLNNLCIFIHLSKILLSLSYLNNRGQYCGYGFGDDIKCQLIVLFRETLSNECKHRHQIVNIVRLQV